jgi:predicted DNA-binding transcriptional regulator AlpA
MDGIYMVKEVCWLLHVSRETIRRWECKGWFPKRIRFTRHARGRVGFLMLDVHGGLRRGKPPRRRPRRLTKTG